MGFRNLQKKLENLISTFGQERETLEDGPSQPYQKSSLQAVHSTVLPGSWLSHQPMAFQILDEHILGETQIARKRDSLDGCTIVLQFVCMAQPRLVTAWEKRPQALFVASSTFYKKTQLSTLQSSLSLSQLHYGCFKGFLF